MDPHDSSPKTSSCCSASFSEHGRLELALKSKSCRHGRAAGSPMVTLSVSYFWMVTLNSPAPEAGTCRFRLQCVPTLTFRLPDLESLDIPAGWVESAENTESARRAISDYARRSAEHAAAAGDIFVRVDAEIAINIRPSWGAVLAYVERMDRKVASTAPPACGKEEGTCPICLEPVLAGKYHSLLQVKLACSHRFHQRCLLPWARMKSTCPYCRSPL